MTGPYRMEDRLGNELNTIAHEVDHAHRFDELALAAWMQANIADYCGPLQVRQFNGGQSNPTYKLITPGRNYVLRSKPAGKLLPSAHAVDREFRVIAALHPSGFPVARPYKLCCDEAVIGRWFYVMEMVDGRIFWDQSLPHCSPSERREIVLSMIGTMADLHNTDHERIGLQDYGRPGNYMARQVDRWSRQYRASQTREVPEIERLIEWLPATVPVQERTTIVHGDYRLPNLIYHAGEPKVRAVLDWELGTLGEPLADVTYCLMNWVSGPFSGLAEQQEFGIPSLEEGVDYYCELTGRSGMPDLNWYFSYNAFRSACIIQGIAGRVRDGTANHPDAARQEGRVAGIAKLGWALAEKAGA